MLFSFFCLFKSVQLSAMSFRLAIFIICSLLLVIHDFNILIVLALGMDTNDLKLISAIILAIVIMVPTFEKKFKLRRTLRNGVVKHD